MVLGPAPRVHVILFVNMSTYLASPVRGTRQSYMDMHDGCSM